MLPYIHLLVLLDKYVVALELAKSHVDIDVLFRVHKAIDAINGLCLYYGLRKRFRQVL